MNELPLDVLAVYAAIVVLLVLAVADFKKQSYTASVLFGIGLVLVLNVRYLFEGAADGIAFFVSLYDVFDNLGLAAGESAPALATCPGNACSVWGERYLNHPSWGVAFHDRFLNGSDFRSNLLYVHLIFNTIVFVLMHYQIARPGTGTHQAFHRVLGRFSFICLTIATICAIWMASSHGSVGEYGGKLSQWGFYAMSFCVYGCAVMGIVAIRGGDASAHRIWMIRFAGSMWGAFLIYRLMLFVTGPLLRDYVSASFLISTWFSAPLGILIADALRKRLDRHAIDVRSNKVDTAVGARGQLS